MSSDHDYPVPTDPDPDDDFLDEAPPSIFRATWVRVVLVVVGVALVSAVSVPYVMDVVNPPPPPPLVPIADVRKPATPAPAAASAAAPTATAQKPAVPTWTATPKPAPAPAAASVPTAPENRTPAMTATTAKGVEPTPVTAHPQKSADVSKSAEPPKAGVAPKPAETAKAAEAPKAATSKLMEMSKAEAMPKPAEAPKTVAPPPLRTSALTTSSVAPRERATAPRAAAQRPQTSDESDAVQSGDFFVQVGAFKDRDTARRLAATLREQKYRVDESTIRLGGERLKTEAPARAAAPRASAPSGTDRYDVIVSGGSSSGINTKLAAKGLAADAVGDTVRIRPRLSLRDAVALSKDLNNEGFKVQVRRSDGAATAIVAMERPVSPGEGGGEMLYRVRLGGYDRSTALSVARVLEGKGYTTFIARGRE